MKPLSEPSQGRENAYLGWTDNQLLRRPPVLAAAFPNLPWAWIGEQTLTVHTSNYAGAVRVDFDPGAGYGFFTNDASTFENVPAPTLYGLTAMRDGVYLGFGIAGFSRNTAITHGTKRAWIILDAPSFATLAAFDFGVTTVLNINAAGTIDASPASWNAFDMILFNLDGTETVPDQTTLTMLVAQESGGDATCLPALFCVRISDGLPGGIS